MELGATDLVDLGWLILGYVKSQDNKILQFIIELMIRMLLSLCRMLCFKLCGGGCEVRRESSIIHDKR